MRGLYPVQYGFDTDGRLSTVSHGPRGAAGDQRVWTYGYDPSDGHLASVHNPLYYASDPLTTLASATTYDERDSAWRVTRIPLPGGDEVLHGYDGTGNVTSVTPPGRPAHDFTCSEQGTTESCDPPPLPASEPHAETLCGDFLCIAFYLANRGDPDAPNVHGATHHDRSFWNPSNQ